MGNSRVSEQDRVAATEQPFGDQASHRPFGRVVTDIWMRGVMPAT